MSESNENARLVPVWLNMANHFLDTETRQDLPITAWCCVQAGLSVTQARAVWQHEVSPAVGFNLFCIAGEWAYWDEDWLIEQIRRCKVSLWHRPGRWRSISSWLPPLMSGQWLTISRCMQLLQAIPEASERKRTTDDLARLARHAFDFCPEDLSTLEPGARQTLRQLYPEPFDSVMKFAFYGSERTQARARVARALSKMGRAA
jgi:hypothetical protein